MEKNQFIPIYQRLTEFYEKKILNQEYMPDQRIDSITRIMDRHGVSRETAKLVLKMLIDKGLVVSKAGKGTFICPRQKLKKVWGMVVPFFSSNIEQLIGFLQEEARVKGRELVYYFDYNSPEEEKQLVGRMIIDGYEAVIVVPNYDERYTAEFYRKLNPGNTRVMLVDNTMAGSYFRYVIQSYDLGVKRALDYLGKGNSGNFLLLKNEVWKGRNLLYQLMEYTFRSLIEAEYPDRRLEVIANVNDLNIGYLKDNNIGGVLCCIDTDAIRLVGRLKQWNFQIPAEISVVSYGDTELIQLFDPPITAVDCKYKEMAYLTAMLLDQERAVGIDEQYVIQPELIIRYT